MLDVGAFVNGGCPAHPSWDQVVNIGTKLQVKEQR